jgi:hypothetical protein
MRYTCDNGMWRYITTGIVHVALRCKFIPAHGVTIDPAQGFAGFAAERYMRCTCDHIGRHAIISGIAESYQGEQNL